MLKSGGRTEDASVMEVEEWPQVVIFRDSKCNDGTPCAGKLACTVWSGGKTGDGIKGLPITITSYADFSEVSWIFSWRSRPGS